jgi:hypothetical protein
MVTVRVRKNWLEIKVSFKREYGTIFEEGSDGSLITNDARIQVETYSPSKLDDDDTYSWLCYEDFSLQGAYEGVDGKATYFDKELGPQSCDYVHEFFSELENAASPNTKLLRPLIMYHGTSRENAIEIIRLNKFNETFGMLGNGVYFGSFYKACRFAARDQNYIFRKQGSILRCLVFVNTKDILSLPKPQYSCQCETCSREQTKFKSICDHESTWREKHFKGCCACACKNLLKNSEWVFPSNELIFIETVADLDMSSINRPHYNPLQRNQRIICNPPSLRTLHSSTSI